jgi:hypothetical protein
MDYIAKPFGWLLLVLYNFTHSYGIAIFLFRSYGKAHPSHFSMKSKKGV